MKRIVARLYAPLFWGGFIGGGLWLAQLLDRPGWLPLFGAALVVSFAAEWLLPYETVLEPPGR